MSRASFGVAPPAGATKPPAVKKPIPGRMPMEIGKAVKVKKLTPEEEKKLLEIGWEQGQPIPENLTDLMDQVRGIQDEATDVENLPPPVPLDTPPLKYDSSREIDISDLPPDEQKRYKELMKRIFKDAETQANEERRRLEAVPGSAGDGVAETILKAMSTNSDIEIEDDTADLDAKKAEKPAVPGLTHCPRCSYPLDQEDPVVVTDEDKDLFLHAADSLQLFTKDFPYLNGGVTVRVRELTHQEQELCYKQMLFDHAQKRIVTNEEIRQLRMRYNMTLQVIRVTAKSKQIERPENLKAWEEKAAKDVEMLEGDTLLRRAYLTTLKEDLPDTIFRFMFRSLMEFDSLQNKLEALSQEPDFWKPRTDAS